MHLSILDRHLPERRTSRLNNVIQHIEHTLTKTWRTDKSPQNTQPAKSTTMTGIRYPPVRPFEYPSASFLGLPVELRVQIYSELAESVHFHIDCGYGQSIKGRKRRLCSAPDPKFRQICTRPDFSGLHPSDDRCYVQVTEFHIRRSICPARYMSPHLPRNGRTAGQKRSRIYSGKQRRGAVSALAGRQTAGVFDSTYYHPRKLLDLQLWWNSTRCCLFPLKRPIVHQLTDSGCPDNASALQVLRQAASSRASLRARAIMAEVVVYQSAE